MGSRPRVLYRPFLSGSVYRGCPYSFVGGPAAGRTRGKAPGLDGLTVEIFRAFWDILGSDYTGVLGESIAHGAMPLSWRRAIIALLLKNGDLSLLKNWRPVFLLRTDKAMSSRLGTVLDRMIHPDQSYTVPGRIIHDNLHLVRDLIHHTQRAGLSSAFLSLDQEKAFDRVEHEYLLETLRAFVQDTSCRPDPITVRCRSVSD